MAKIFLQLQLFSAKIIFPHTPTPLGLSARSQKREQNLQKIREMCNSGAGNGNRTRICYLASSCSIANSDSYVQNSIHGGEFSSKQACLVSATAEHAYH